MVVRNDIVYLVCSVTGGNPLPVLRWNINNEATMIINGNRVSKSISWQATGRGPVQLICQSFHPDRIDTVYVTVTILFPPEKIEVTLNMDTQSTPNVKQSFSVLENASNSMELMCSARSNPSPSSYWWTGPVKSNSARLELNMTRTVRGVYTCNVNNTMITYDGLIKDGFNSVSYNLEILQQPNIGTLEYAKVVEGYDFTIACPIINGMETWRSVKWLNKQNLPVGQNGSLFLKNTMRTANGTYTCQLDFTMQPTYGLHKNVTLKKGFYLDVLYKADILSLSINNEVNSLAVNETSRVHFVCDVDSNPSSTVEIGLNNTILSSKSNTRTLDYLIHSVNCNDTGTYVCTGNNTYIAGHQAKRNNTLFVNCSPRQSPSFKLKQNVTSVMNATAAFRFTAMAYPPPSLQWYRILNGSKLSEAKGGVVETYSVSTNEIRTSLTLDSVEQIHYGEYLLKIENLYGTFNQTFYLLPKELSMETLTTSRSVGPAVGGALGGLLAVIVVIVSVLIIRKRLIGTRRKAPDNGIDSHAYQNFPKDNHTVDHTIPDSSSSAEYEMLQQRGPEVDQRYQQLTAFSKKSGLSTVNVYENLQLSHPNKPKIEESD